MKPHEDGRTTRWCESLEEDELEYHLHSEQIVLSARQYFSWEDGDGKIEIAEETARIEKQKIRKISSSSAGLILSGVRKQVKAANKKIYMNSGMYLYISFREFPENCTDYISYINRKISFCIKDKLLKTVKNIDFNIFPFLISEDYERIKQIDSYFSRNRYFPAIDVNWIFQKKQEYQSVGSLVQGGEEEAHPSDTGYIKIKNSDNIDCKEINLNEILKVEIEEKGISLDDEYDWIGLSENFDEYDEHYESEHENVEIDCPMGREERATQEAIELGRMFDFEIRDIEIIAKIFVSNGWMACKEALIRELENGATISEIESAANIKEIWNEHCEFYSGQKSNYRILTWPTALKFIRKFSECPNSAEAEHFLISLYNHWYSSGYQRKIFSSFNKYLVTCLHSWDDEFGWTAVLTDENDIRDEYFPPPNSADIPIFHQEYLEKYLKFIRSIENKFD